MRVELRIRSSEKAIQAPLPIGNTRRLTGDLQGDMLRVECAVGPELPLGYFLYHVPSGSVMRPIEEEAAPAVANGKRSKAAPAV